MSTDYEQLLAHFQQLIEVPPEQRPALLESLDLDAETRSELAALLAADARFDTRLERAFYYGAERFAAKPQGLVLGPWRVLRELGAGGMGTVFLAERADGAFRQQVAVKVLRGFPTEEGSRRLRLERRLLATLDHPYIARLIDGGETDDGQPYLVMEYVEGEPITAHVARQNLDVAARVALLDRVAEAVAHAHQRLVIHRDLKPSNVLVRADGTPRVLDFGVAKLLGADGDSSGTSTRVWTPGYASPEQKAGAAVTTATDVYALGILLGELLTGRRPDGRPSDPPLAAVAPDRDLSGIVAKATQEEVSARYPTVEALRDDLARWREGRPVRAARMTTLYRLRKFIRRHRVGVGAGVLLLIALLAFLWQLNVERSRALAAEALAEQRRIRAEQAAETARGTLDFFAKVLADVSPEQTGSRTLTIDDWLERASARLARELPTDAPEAALYGGYLGAMYGSLGDTAKAIARLEPALARLEAQALDGSALYADLASNLAGQLFAAGRTQDAAAWSRRAAAAWRRQADAGDVRAPLRAAMAEGYAHYLLGELEAAVASYRAGLALPVPANADAQVRDLRAVAAQFVADSLKALGRSEEALALLDQARAELLATGGARTLSAARIERVRSDTLLTLGRSAEALAASEAALAINAEIHGPRGRLYAALLNQRGIVLNELGRFSESRAAFVAALEAARAAGVAEDPIVRGNLANACDSVGDAACARQELERLLADPDARAAVLPGQRRQWQQMLGRALSQSGDYDAARRLLEDTLAAVLKEDGPSSPNAAATLIHLARNEQRAARYASALDYARRARAVYAAIVPPGHYIYAVIDRIEGYVALGQQRLDEATRLLEAHHAATLAGDGPESLWGALAGLDLAALRHAQGRDDEARALLREHLPRVRGTVLPTHVDRAAAEKLAASLGVE